MNRTTLAAALLAAASVLAATPATARTLLPKPRHMVKAKGNFALTKPYHVENRAGDAAINVYTTEIFGDAAVTNAAAATRRLVRLALPADTAAWQPEQYALHVAPDTIIIEATGKEGFLRAAQTLAQLAGSHGRSIPCTDIGDSPELAWRGVMIDVSRHFFPITFLRRQVDILARYKINRLHLHLTDAAGWRMEIKRYPRLTQFAAWRTDTLWKHWWNDTPRHYADADTPGAYGGFYTQEELRSLVRYAEARGITIVPEIEMPAHSEEVLTAYPELSCTHEPYRQADFCPGSVATYDFLENVLQEVMDVFPSRDIHVGGDEAGKASWPACPLCQKKMREQGLDGVDDLQTHLIRRMGRFLESHGRRLVGWDEVTADSLPPSTTIMVWRDTDGAREAARRGLDVVLTPGAYCYLDGYQDAPPTQPEAIGGYLTLERVYSYRPGEEMTPEERRHLRGLQGNLWTEYVPTEQHAEYMLYPRALAIAETAWTGNASKNFSDFFKRACAEVEYLRKEKNINAFDLKNEVGERPEKAILVKHKALGAKVTYNLPYHPYYPAGGNNALTDGLRGGWANNDGRWQGFITGRRFDVTIDLGREERISQVSTDFMQACGPEIYYPSAYIVSTSTDGTAFTEIYRRETPSEKTSRPDVRTYTWRGPARTARYVRIQALPATFGGWLFTDEVVIR